MCLLVFSVSLAFSAKVTSGLLGEGRHRLRSQAKLEVPSGRSPQITMPGACHRAGEPTGGRVHLWQEARCPVPCTTLKEPDTYRVTRDAIFSALPRTPDGFADVRGGGRRSAEEEREEPRNQRERRRGRKCACRSPVIRSARGPSRVAVIAIAIRRCVLCVLQSDGRSHGHESRTQWDGVADCCCADRICAEADVRTCRRAREQ